MNNKNLIKPETIIAILSESGYSSVHRTKKQQAFQKSGNQPLYVNLASREGVSALILHPDQSDRRGEYDAIPGVAVGAGTYHNSNLILFPKRRHTGENPIGYGIPVEFASESAFRDFLRAYDGLRVPSLSPATPAPIDGPTSREVAAQARVGQDVFRNDLIRYWKACAVTGLESPLLLRASHIKPWHEASDAERRDHFNGLLLAAHLDAAFDQGLISFDDAGQILLSPQLSTADRSRLQLDTPRRLRTVDARHQGYLAYHRSNIFKAQ